MDGVLASAAATEHAGQHDRDGAHQRPRNFRLRGHDLPGRGRGNATIVSPFEAVGAYAAGKMSKKLTASSATRARRLQSCVQYAMAPRSRRSGILLVADGAPIKEKADSAADSARVLVERSTTASRAHHAAAIENASRS
jgi:hypothetical protein